MTMAMSRPSGVELAQLAALAESSIQLIKTLQDASGAYPASPTFSAYRGYSWFRDGAFIADGASSGGAVDSASAFFDWCGRILCDREAQIANIVASAASVPVADADMLATRFTFAGSAGDDKWWDFQLDGYGTWLWAVVEHATRHSLPLDRWGKGIELTVDYLLSSWRRPCFDWWEENADRVHVSTLGCISGGLAAVLASGLLDTDRQTAVKIAVDDISTTISGQGVFNGHLAKWLGSEELDASLLAVLSPLGVVPASSPVGLTTIAAIDDTLTVGGGVHRYLADTFYGGGQWPLLSCLLGLAYSAAGDEGKAWEQLRWAASTTTDDGTMPEQVDEHLLHPSMKQEWLDRWGAVATPLLWTHAMYIRLAVELGVIDGGAK